MVKIIGLKQMENQDGKPFVSLEIEGGIDFVQSQSTGRLYMTSRKCMMATTFDENKAKSLIGTELPGSVERVETDPYDYTIKDTGEVIILAHRWDYVPEGGTQKIVASQLVKDELVEDLGEPSLPI
jgi:hypothetical protein